MEHPQQERRIDWAEVAVGLFCLVVFLAFLFIVIPLGIEMPRRLQNPLISPSFLPTALGWFLAGLGGALALRALLIPAVPKAAEEGAEPDRIWAIAFVIFMILAYWLFSETLGMLLTSCIISLVLIWFGGARKWYLFMIGGLAVPVGIYLLFVKLAQVPLPRGDILPF